jgi:hypothetical protein
VESKFYKDLWSSNERRALQDFESFRNSSALVVFADTGDSTGNVIAQVLPYVDSYWKAQLWRDRSAYETALYGGRPYTDYYHRNFGVTDSSVRMSVPVDREFLPKLRVSWNLGFTNYGFLGPRLADAYMFKDLDIFIRPIRRISRPGHKRNIELFLRMNLEYSRETVAYQRRQVVKRLQHRTQPQAGRVGRFRYLRELCDAKVVVSPFGWGEINVRDFEAILCGAALLKPNMEHIETYPDVFHDGETIISHKWDLSDLESVIASASDSDLSAIASRAQKEYLDQVSGESFKGRFLGLLGEVTRDR